MTKETKNKSLIPVEKYDLTAPEDKLIKRGLKIADSLHHSLTIEEWNELQDWLILSDLEEKKEWHGILELVKGSPTYTSSIAWRITGDAYYNLKRYDEAIEAYFQAVDIDPEYVLAWYNIGKVAETLAAYDEAIKAYNQTISINPDLADVWLRLGYIYYAKLTRYEDAIKAYRQLVRINPQFVDAWNLLAGSYHHLKYYNEAIEASCHAIRIDPKNKQAWIMLVICYCESGNQNGALDAANELRRFDPAEADELLREIKYIFNDNILE